jgi:hypothetical protein
MNPHCHMSPRSNEILRPYGFFFPILANGSTHRMVLQIRVRTDLEVPIRFQVPGNEISLCKANKDNGRNKTNKRK